MNEPIGISETHTFYNFLRLETVVMQHHGDGIFQVLKITPMTQETYDKVLEEIDNAVRA